MARSDCFPKLGWCNVACFLLLAITTGLLFVERVAAQRSKLQADTIYTCNTQVQTCTFYVGNISYSEGKCIVIV